MPFAPPPNKGGTQTVSALFSQNRWEQWWTDTGIQHFNARPGSNNCTDPGATEFGNDYNPSYKAVIRAIQPGIVIYAQKPPEYSQPGHSSVGYVIQIQAGDGSIMHFQHMLSTPLRNGNAVAVGDIVGVAGGCPEGCYGPNQCSCVDDWSTGAHIEVRYSPRQVPGNAPWCNGNWIDPIPVVTAIVGGLPVSASGGQNPFTGISSSLTKIPNPFAPNNDVAATFAAIDDQFALTPLLPPLPTNINVLNAPVEIFGWTWELMFNWTKNIIPLFLRAFLLIVGAAIVIKVMNNLTHASQMFGNALQSASSLAPLLLA